MCSKTNKVCLAMWPTYTIATVIYNLNISFTNGPSDLVDTLAPPLLLSSEPISRKIKRLQQSPDMQPPRQNSQHVHVCKNNTTSEEEILKIRKSEMCLTSGRVWRRSWCCHRQLGPAAPWNSALSAPRGFPSPSPTPAAEKESDWWGAAQVMKQEKKKKGGREGGERMEEVRERGAGRERKTETLESLSR